MRIRSNMLFCGDANMLFVREAVARITPRRLRGPTTWASRSGCALTHAFRATGHFRAAATSVDASRWRGKSGHATAAVPSVSHLQQQPELCPQQPQVRQHQDMPKTQAHQPQAQHPKETSSVHIVRLGKRALRPLSLHKRLHAPVIPAAAAVPAASQSVANQPPCLSPTPPALDNTVTNAPAEVHTDPADLRTCNSSSDLSGVTVVRGNEAAQRLVQQLMALPTDALVACDTEVMQFDKNLGPIGNGRVTCLSLYAGPEHDFGNGPLVWVDDLDGAWGTVAAMRDWLEDANRLKVWHHYAFDRHVLHNWPCLVDTRGLGGDTMHMARLWDTARSKGGLGGYSLAALTTSLLGDSAAKRTMKEIFGTPHIKKDGTPGKVIVVPPVERLQREERWRSDWIQYSVDDARLTWELHEFLCARLEEMPWAPKKSHEAEATELGEATNPGLVTGLGERTGEHPGVPEDGQMLSMLDFYKAYIVPFAECLTDIERNGIAINEQHLRESERRAESERVAYDTIFREWVSAPQPPNGLGCGCEDGALMNVSSDAQKQALLFAPAANAKKNADIAPMAPSRVFEIENIDGYVEPGREGKPPKKKRPITIIGQGMPPLKYTGAGWPSVNGEVLRTLAGDVPSPIAIGKLEATADPLAASGDENARYGPAYDFFAERARRAFASHTTNEFEIEKQSHAAGAAACRAIDALCQISSIDTMLSNFIVPLQEMGARGGGRIHCSMNLNTETGRLSARRPNLQNQPALEKDRYKVRDAFVAAGTAAESSSSERAAYVAWLRGLGPRPGTADAAEAAAAQQRQRGGRQTLLVADYGQLELRLLAHITKCSSMIAAFETGGDFHSRTAMGMYPDTVGAAVESGETLLEWDRAANGGQEPPVPLLKDAFAAERRKAKTLNFSIAYGKTAHGLARDWGVSVSDARKTLDAWYEDRPEVRDWQMRTIEYARETGYTRTLMGRYRRLPDAVNGSSAARAHAERAAINTPIQGGAADVVMMAMLKLHRNEKLRAMGWRMVLQIHDEIIFEGPEESAAEATAMVTADMCMPFRQPLLVDLEVDPKIESTWYRAK